MVDPHLLVPARVLWVLLCAFVANATATFSHGRGPSMDLGRTWPWDGRRVLGPSKTWAGFVIGTAIAVPCGLLEAWLVLIAPPSLQLVPSYGPSLLAALPVVVLLSAGAMAGDALGSFVKRRFARPSGARTLLLDQLPFVLVPIVIGLAVYPAIFVPTFLGGEAILWLLLFTLGFHAAFNWIGFKLHLKKVPW
ncbi:MAG: CDP-archaeol synthase [Thermoplasmata archaeon]